MRVTTLKIVFTEPFVVSEHIMVECSRFLHWGPQTFRNLKKLSMFLGSSYIILCLLFLWICFTCQNVEISYHIFLYGHKGWKNKLTALLHWMDLCECSDTKISRNSCSIVYKCGVEFISMLYAYNSGNKKDSLKLTSFLILPWLALCMYIKFG